MDGVERAANPKTPPNIQHQRKYAIIIIKPLAKYRMQRKSDVVLSHILSSVCTPTDFYREHVASSYVCECALCVGAASVRSTMNTRNILMSTKYSLNFIREVALVCFGFVGMMCASRNNCFRITC